MKNVHYILNIKPWQGRRADPQYQKLTDWWWKRFDMLDEEMKARDPQGRAVIWLFIKE